MLDNINVHNKAIVFACKVCVLNIKRKGVAPAYIMKMMKELLIISQKALSEPDENKIFDSYSRRRSRSFNKWRKINHPRRSTKKYPKNLSSSVKKKQY